MKRILALMAVGVLFALAVTGHSIAASSFSYGFTSEYDIAKDGQASIRHIVDVTNNGSEQTPSSISLPVSGDGISAVSASLNDGAALTAVWDEASGIIKVTIPDQSGEGKKWSFDLSYRANLLKELGAVKAAQIPSLNDVGLNIVSQTTVVSASLETGLASVRPSTEQTSISVGKQIFTYKNASGPVEDSISVIFGDAAVYEVQTTQELKNNGWWWKTLELTLPPDTNQQQVILKSISPQPSNVRLDEDGNILAQFRVGPKKSVEVTATALISVKNLAYELSSLQRTNDIDPAIKERYLRMTDRWQKTGLEVAASTEQPVTEITKAVYDAVVKLAKQEINQTDNLISLETVNSRKYADMLVGELRSYGVPARVVLGRLLTNGDEIIESGQSAAWAEAFVPGGGWITLDPTLGAQGDYYGTSDVLHVGLVLWGIADDKPPIDLEATKLSAQPAEAFVVPEDQPTLTVRKNMIFPGISLLDITTSFPAGVISDGAAVAYDGKTISLGSVAPLQTTHSRSLLLLGSSFSVDTVDFGFTSGGELISSLASADSSVNFMPIVYEIAAIVIGLTVFLFIRRRIKGRSVRRSKNSVLMHIEDSGQEVEEEDLVSDVQIETPNAAPQVEQSQTPTVPSRPVEPMPAPRAKQTDITTDQRATIRTDENSRFRYRVGPTNEDTPRRRKVE